MFLWPRSLSCLVVRPLLLGTHVGRPGLRLAGLGLRLMSGVRLGLLVGLATGSPLLGSLLAGRSRRFAAVRPRLRDPLAGLGVLLFLLVGVLFRPLAGLWLATHLLTRLLLSACLLAAYLTGRLRSVRLPELAAELLPHRWLVVNLIAELLSRLVLTAYPLLALPRLGLRRRLHALLHRAFHLRHDSFEPLQIALHHRLGEPLAREPLHHRLRDFDTLFLGRVLPLHRAQGHSCDVPLEVDRLFDGRLALVHRRLLELFGRFVLGLLGLLVVSHRKSLEDRRSSLTQQGDGGSDKGLRQFHVEERDKPLKRLVALERRDETTHNERRPREFPTGCAGPRVTARDIVYCRATTVTGAVIGG